MRHILFVCTGNTCRSPMAESILRHLAKEKGHELEVRSAGVSAWNGSPMSEHAQQVLKDWQMGNNEFASQMLSEQTVGWADLILTLTSGHKQHVLQLYPSAVDKTFTLKEYADVPANLEVMDELTSLVADLQIKLASGQQPAREELSRLRELQQQVPSLDIQDPFGGPLGVYKQTAEEIQTAIRKVIDRLFPI